MPEKVLKSYLETEPNQNFESLQVVSEKLLPVGIADRKRKLPSIQNYSLHLKQQSSCESLHDRQEEVNPLDFEEPHNASQKTFDLTLLKTKQSPVKRLILSQILSKKTLSMPSSPRERSPVKGIEKVLKIGKFVQKFRPENIVTNRLSKEFFLRNPTVQNKMKRQQKYKSRHQQESTYLDQLREQFASFQQ